MVRLTVDPGLSGCGWSVWKDGDLVEAGFVAGEGVREPETWGSLAAEVVGRACLTPDEVVVETMRVYTQGKSDPADLFALQGLAGALLGVAHARGMKGRGFLASKWKGQVPRDVTGARVERDIEIKAWGDRVRWPTRKTWRNDVCHAIALGQFMNSLDAGRWG
jgi:hypothetical protein